MKKKLTETTINKSTDPAKYSTIYKRIEKQLKKAGFSWKDDVLVEELVASYAKFHTIAKECYLHIKAKGAILNKTSTVGVKITYANPAIDRLNMATSQMTNLTKAIYDASGVKIAINLAPKALAKAKDQEAKENLSPEDKFRSKFLDNSKNEFN